MSDNIDQDVSTTTDTTAGQGKGGGPKTAHGKRRSRMNATKYGVQSSAWRLPTEDPKEIEAIAAAVFDHFRPVGDLEAEACRRIAFCYIRRRRIERYEQAAQARVGDLRVREAEELDLNASPEAFKLYRIDPLDARRLGESVPEGVALEKLTRWDSHTSRQLRSALEELETLRAMRHR